MWPLRHLPAPALVIVARAFASLAFDIFRARRAVTLANLAIAFPEKPEPERRRIARASYEHAFYGAAEFVRMTRQGALANNHLQITSINEPDVSELLKDHGVIVTLGHFGSWEFLAHYWMQRGVNLTILYKPMHNPIVDAEFLRMRQGSNAHFLSTRTEPRQMLSEMKRAAENKGVLVFLADQDARKDGVFVPFFGKNASTAAGPATMALRLNLPILPLACIRTGLWNFQMIFGELIEPLPGGRTPENIHHMTEMHAAALEQMIRLAPEQYMWFHDRWKSAPRKKR